jgi:cell fate (sporulation/competence/biofilm development) regulator YlbF (YheA/YmcA/DUF963 family)
MSIYHEIAVELANAILASEVSKDYVDSKAAFRADDEESELALAEYLRCKAEYENLINSVIETFKNALGLETLSGGGCCRGRK